MHRIAHKPPFPSSSFQTFVHSVQCPHSSVSLLVHGLSREGSGGRRQEKPRAANPPRTRRRRWPARAPCIPPPHDINQVIRHAQFHDLLRHFQTSRALDGFSASSRAVTNAERPSRPIEWELSPSSCRLMAL